MNMRIECLCNVCSRVCSIKNFSEILVRELRLEWAGIERWLKRRGERLLDDIETRSLLKIVWLRDQERALVWLNGLN